MPSLRSLQYQQLPEHGAKQSKSGLYPRDAISLVE